VQCDSETADVELIRLLTATPINRVAYVRAKNIIVTTSLRYNVVESRAVVVYHGRERRAAADDRTLWRSSGCVMRRDAARSVIGGRAGPAIWVARWQSIPPREKPR